MIVQKVTHHSAANATATGNVMNLSGISHVAVQITGSFSATVTFKATVDGTNYVAVQGVNASTGAKATTATAAGLYLVPVAGYLLFECDLTWTSGTSITVTGRGVDVASGLNLADVEVAADVGLGTTADAPNTNASSTTEESVITLLKSLKNYVRGILTVKFDQTTPGTTNGVVVNAGTAAIGSLVQPVAPAETVVAGAASILGKITTVAAGTTVWGRIPCAATSPATFAAIARVKCDKAHTLYFARARTVLNAPTATFASAQVNDTFLYAGLTFTAKAAESLGAREFSQAGTDAQTATSAAACVTAAMAALGASAAGNGAVMTVTATTATATQLVTGVGGARITCAQTMPATLAIHQTIPGLAANSTTDGVPYTVEVNGYPHLYVGMKNDDAVNAATFVLGGTPLAV